MGSASAMWIEVQEEEARKERERLMADPDFINSGFDDLESWLDYRRALERDCVPEKAINEGRTAMTFDSDGNKFVSDSTFEVEAPPKAINSEEKEIIVGFLRKSGVPYRLEIDGHTWTNIKEDESQKKKREPRCSYDWTQMESDMQNSSRGQRLRFEHPEASLQNLQNRVCGIATKVYGGSGYRTRKDRQNNCVFLVVKKTPGLYKLQG